MLLVPTTPLFGVSWLLVSCTSLGLHPSLITLEMNPASLARDAGFPTSFITRAMSSVALPFPPEGEGKAPY